MPPGSTLDKSSHLTVKIAEVIGNRKLNQVFFLHTKGDLKCLSFFGFWVYPFLQLSCCCYSGSFDQGSCQKTKSG